MDEIELDNISWDYLITEGTNIKIKILFGKSWKYSGYVASKLRSPVKTYDFAWLYTTSKSHPSGASKTIETSIKIIIDTTKVSPKRI